MDNLKSAIADKILDLSTSGGDEMRMKLERINRFRDFSEACRSLIVKYPAIEAELMRMVESNDFDTKIASSRVDTIIRLSETNTSSSQVHINIEKDITELEKIEEHLPPTPTSQEIPPQIEEKEQVGNEIVTIPVLEEKEAEQYLPEDVDYEEVKPLAIGEGDKEDEKEYAAFEEVVPQSNNFTVSPSPQAEENNVKEFDTTDKKETVKKVLLVCGVIAVIIAVIFIVKFVITHWQLVLWILGGLVAVGIAVLVIKKNKEKSI